MLSKISPTTHCDPHPKHQWAAKERHERKSLILDRNINMVFRTDTGNDIDNGCRLKCLCFLCFRASWTVWCHFNTNADKWPQPRWNIICSCGCFFFFFLPKTPSQIQADIDASEGGQCRPSKNLSQRKVEKPVENLPLTLIRSTVSSSSLLVKKKKKPSSKLWWRSTVTIKMRQTSFVANKEKLRKGEFRWTEYD